MIKLNSFASKISEFFVSPFWYLCILTVYLVRLTTYYKINPVIITLTIFTSLLPVLVYQKVRKVNLDHREERPSYLLFFVMGLLLSHLIALAYKISILSHLFLFLATIITLPAIISMFYKISLHMILNTTTYIVINHYFQWHFWILIIVIPLIGWSRIILRKHSLFQVLLGTFLPIGLALIFGFFKFN
jgi:membrane-associated phospholipid phosphatase